MKKANIVCCCDQASDTVCMYCSKYIRLKPIKTFNIPWPRSIKSAKLNKDISND